MSLLQHIVQSLQTLNYNFAIQEEPLHELIARYLLLIEKWNKIYNLTAIRDPQDMIAQHVLDSLAALPYIKGSQIVDVGSGAGFPGIPLALARPDWNVILVESNQKKASFLQQAKIELALRNVQVIPKRIENVESEKQVSTIISRAFSELGEFVRLTRQLAGVNNPDCNWIAMKADCPMKELKQVQNPFSIEKIVTLQVPGIAAIRQLVIIKKMQ
jgi:16S rRNA (guanine527-N7)-methyltransferase